MPAPDPASATRLQADMRQGRSAECVRVGMAADRCRWPVSEVGEAVRRRAKVDHNQAVIVDALRRAGASVFSLAECGGGIPDLLVGRAGKTALLEVKDSAQPPNKRRLTPDQLKWHAEWRGGTLAVVCDVESALRVLKVMDS